MFQISMMKRKISSRRKKSNMTSELSIDDNISDAKSICSVGSGEEYSIPVSPIPITTPSSRSTRSSPGDSKRPSFSQVSRRISERKKISLALSEASFICLDVDSVQELDCSDTELVPEPEEIRPKCPLKKLSTRSKETYSRMVDMRRLRPTEEDEEDITINALHKRRAMMLNIPLPGETPEKHLDSSEMKDLKTKQEAIMMSSISWRNKADFPIPNLSALKVYEKLYLQMASLFDVATRATAFGDPCVARLAVCLSSAATDMSLILSLAISLHQADESSAESKQVKETPEVAPNERHRPVSRKARKFKKRMTRPKTLKRRGLGVIGRKTKQIVSKGANYIVIKDEASKDAYITELFNKVGYSPVEKLDVDAQPLNILSKLQHAFHQLSMDAAKHANELYEHSKLFVISPEFQLKSQASTIRSNQELLELAENKLCLCHSIAKILMKQWSATKKSKQSRQKQDSYYMTAEQYAKVLKTLDMDNLSFLHPVVLENVQFFDAALVGEDGKINFLRHLENNKTMFLANTAPTNMLFNIEQSILKEHFPSGILVDPSKVSNWLNY